MSDLSEITIIGLIALMFATLMILLLLLIHYEMKRIRHILERFSDVGDNGGEKA